MSVSEAFTKNVAGIAFTDCDLLGAVRTRARPQARPAARGKGRARPAARSRAVSVVGHRRVVGVGGRRAKTIDVDAHCVIPEAYALLGLKGAEHRGPGIEQGGTGRLHAQE